MKTLVFSVSPKSEGWTNKLLNLVLKDIEDYKNKITQAEKDIEKNLKDQETAKTAVETQKGAVEQIKKKLSDVK